MKNFNSYLEQLLVTITPQNDTPVPSDDVEEKPTDMFSTAADDIMKNLGMNDATDGEDVIQPDDNVGETGEIQGDSNVELECMGESGMRIKFNGMEMVLPKNVIDAIKSYESESTDESEQHDEAETETETEHEEHEAQETPEEEQEEHAEGESESEEDDETVKTESVKKGKAVNPWAVCNASTGGKKKAGKEKFERCVQDVKSKHKIKK
jgi:hypothetical protein